MIRLLLRISVPFALLLVLSGCTDIVEPNQLAFVLGTSIDNADNGQVEIGYQIVIPTQKNGPFGGGSDHSEGFIVLSAQGKDIFEAGQKLQKKVSRKLMTSHRVLTAVSEDFLQHNDIRKLFDKLNRDPSNNQRDLAVMIQGSAKQFLMLGHPMEHLSSIAANKELQMNGLRRFSTRQFVIDSVSEGTRPLMPALHIQTSKLSDKTTTPLAEWSGYVMLNKQLKIAGMLNEVEGPRVVWMAGKGAYQGVTVPWKEGGGDLSFRITHLKRRIHSEGGNPEHIRLTVKGQAYLLENTTPLDMSDVGNMMKVQQYVNAQLQKEMQDTMNTVRQRGADVFGIGEYLHRQYPHWWKSHKADWDEYFKHIDVSVRADVKFRSSGASGASLKH
jgi:Ger(x)C family germination protein